MKITCGGAETEGRMSATAIAPHALGEDIPTVCLVDDVLRILRMSRSTFDRQLASGDLALIECKRIGRLRRFTGESVALEKQTRWAQTG